MEIKTEEHKKIKDEVLKYDKELKEMKKKTNLEEKLINEYKLKQKIYDAKRYEKNKEKLKEKYELNKEKIKAYMKAYYKKNKDKYKQKYIENGVKIREYNREYKKRIKEQNKN